MTSAAMSASRIRSVAPPMAKLTRWSAARATTEWVMATPYRGPLESPHMAVADHDVLGRRHLREPHRPSGVQLLGADPDLRAEAELPAVGEPRRCVDQHR